MSPTKRASVAIRSDVLRGLSVGAAGANAGGGGTVDAEGDSSAGGVADVAPYDAGGRCADGDAATLARDDSASVASAPRIRASARESRIRIVASRAPKTLARSENSSP